MKDGEKLEPKRAAMKRARVVGRPRNSGDPNAPSPRDTILLEASKLFSQKGYAGTSMAEIADVVGIRGPSLYYHFADKADLLRALTDIGLGETLRDSGSLRRDAAHSVPTRLYYLIHELVVRLRSSSYEMRFFFDPALRSKQFADVTKRIVDWLSDLEAIIKEGIENGDFVVEDAKVASYTIRGMIETAMPRFGAYMSFDAQALADYVAGFALRALLRRPSRLDEIQREFRRMSSQGGKIK